MGGSPSLKYSSLKKLQSIMIVVDIWRVRNPSFRQFTWRRSNPPKTSRIDFFLISNEMQYNVRFCKHLPSFLSDHSSVILRVSSLADSESRGRGYWEFNNSLTNDNKFVETLKNNICEWIAKFDSQQDPRVKWEFLKYKVFRFSKNYANKLAQKRKEKRKSLENKVIMLEKHLVETELKSETLTLEYESAKADLEKINNYIASGAIFRSNVRWYDEGGKNTSYFLSLQKRNKANSHIRKIINTNDVEITDEKMILKEVNNFCSNLYSKKSLRSVDECLQYLAFISMPQLSSTDREVCEGKTTMQTVGKHWC